MKLQEKQIVDPMTDLILQLHITGNCNLRCRHCYIEEHSHNMPLEQIKRVVSQFEELHSFLEQDTGRKIRAHIHFSGGEPLLHPQIQQILRFFRSQNTHFFYGIMSNGTALRLRTLLLLKQLRLKAFQVSLDGDEPTHDAIRGSGNFRKVVKALDVLHCLGIPTRVSFTANRENYALFPKVAETCRKHRVGSLWSDRYIPFASGNGILPITEAEMPQYAAILQREKENPENRKRHLKVQNYRALQFSCPGDPIYSCKAGETLITVDEYGNILPCRRLPMVCGNIADTDLLTVYQTSTVFQSLRAHTLQGKCVSCQFAQQCKGGARCFTYVLEKDHQKPDPCCWR